VCLTPCTSRQRIDSTEWKVMGQFDVAAALGRHLAIPQTRDRRYNTKLAHDRMAVDLDPC